VHWSDVVADEASEPVRIRREMEQRFGSSKIKSAAE